MAGKKRWIDGPLDRGVKEITLSKWRWFSDYVNQELLDYTTYIYRGHADASWMLEPTLDRVVSQPRSQKRARHLQAFKYSVRGRRGSNPAVMATENDWWALGQHHGLSTPLLDWTESPFVALFFAMVGAKAHSARNCCVWALSQASVRRFSTAIENDDLVKAIAGRKPITEIFRPLSDENSRLVNQRGLFTRSPNNVSLEDWIQQYQAGSKSEWHLIKITIPKSDSDDCLRYLNRMNINHSTLFPDLYGASRFCNMDLQITRY